MYVSWIMYIDDLCVVTMSDCSLECFNLVILLLSCVEMCLCLISIHTRGVFHKTCHQCQMTFFLL